MEVHHHSHHPKKWKEYITEFIMLFAAVTLGFFAENTREHQIITHRIEANKLAILKDLKSDSAEIARIIERENKSINQFNRINHLLFLAKAKEISSNQLIDSLKATPDFLAYSTTLYMNNSSFKNMQSSGLLSNLEDGELKNMLAQYYEVDFKSTEAANEFFDNIGIAFNNYYPIGLGKIIREYQKFSKEYETNDPKSFENFMFNLNKTKEIMQSDEFVYEVQKFYNFIFVYRVSLLRTQKSNEKLIKILTADLKE